MTKEKHEHKYELRAKQRVTLTAGTKVAVDTLKQYKCKCGKLVTYDLERELK